MPKVVFFILLNYEGDVLEDLGSNSWQVAKNFNTKTTFETREKATEYINELSIRSIWPEATVQSTLE